MIGLDLDDLMDQILAAYDRMPPGHQAQAEQDAAKVRHHMTSLGFRPTVDACRKMYGNLLLSAAAVGPGPDTAWMAEYAVGACLLRRQIEQEARR